MINNFDFYKPALELGKLLEEFKGVNTVVLDLRDAHIWTDFFIITTVTSAAHAVLKNVFMKVFLNTGLKNIIQSGKALTAMNGS